jgi:hypothetical protein
VIATRQNRIVPSGPYRNVRMKLFAHGLAVPPGGVMVPLDPPDMTTVSPAAVRSWTSYACAHLPSWRMSL